MSNELYAQVTKEFLENEEPVGFVVVACSDFNNVSDFTEHGYDTVSEEQPVVTVCIHPDPDLNFASNEDVYSAAEAVGIDVYMDLDTFKTYYPNSKESEFEERSYMHERTEPNTLLENPDVVGELEKRGFDAFRGSIVIANYEPDVTCFWRVRFGMTEVAKVKDAKTLSFLVDAPEEPAILWIADFETPNSVSRAFGNTPEEAVTKLVELWKNEHAPMAGADEDYITEFREEVTVSPFEVGKAYLKGVTDSLWHDNVLSGADSRFDDVFEASPAPKF